MSSPRPTAPSTVRDAISEHYGALSAQQKRAADYLLANHRVAFALSVHDLAEQASVSEATLVRFAREIGYAGYQELRAALMDEAKQGLAPEDRFAYEPPSGKPVETVGKVARQEVDNVNRTIDDLDPRQFARFIKRLEEGATVATVGLGVSTILAQLAAYQLGQIGVSARFLDSQLLTLVEQVDLLPGRSRILAFGFPPYSRQTVAAVQRARARRVPVLAITDGPDSPLAKNATHALYARSANVLFTNSLSGAIVLINAVVTELALADKPRALKRLRASQDAYDEHG